MRLPAMCWTDESVNFLLLPVTIVPRLLITFTTLISLLQCLYIKDVIPSWETQEMMCPCTSSSRRSMQFRSAPTPTAMCPRPCGHTKSRARPRADRRIRLSYNDVHVAIQKTAERIKAEFGELASLSRPVSTANRLISDLIHPSARHTFRFGPVRAQPRRFSSLSAEEDSSQHGFSGRSARSTTRARRGTSRSRRSGSSFTSPWVV